MAKKTPGKLNKPPPQAEFDQLNLEALCGEEDGIYYRLHSIDGKTGNPWPPLHFSKRGTTRFDPSDGVGTLYLAQSLQGALMEIFDDRWGAVGDPGRSITLRELREWRVTIMNPPKVKLFDATGQNLSKIGTDGQLLTGDYSVTREWAKRLMMHPHAIDGIRFRSRHDLDLINIALFDRAGRFPPLLDVGLHESSKGKWKRSSPHGSALVHGPSIELRSHPAVNEALVRLQVAVLP